MLTKNLRRVVVVMLLFLMIIGTYTVSAFAADGQYIYGDGKNSQYSIRLDGPHYNGDVYHVHFYKYTKHLYCMKLSDFKVCDKKNSDRSSVPEWLMDQAMNDSRVQKRVKQYNPSISNNSGLIRGLLIAGTGVLVILAALNVFTGTVDDLAAWTLFLKAIAG